MAPTESPMFPPTNTYVTTQLEDFFGFDVDGDGYPEYVESKSVSENLDKTFIWLKE